MSFDEKIIELTEKIPSLIDYLVSADFLSN